MKKYLLTALMLITGVALYAQSQKVQTAIISQRYGELDKAKAAIDEAVVHPKTSKDAKAWFYRGDIYLSLHNNEKYGNLTDDALKVALESYKNCLAYDTKNDYSDDINKTKLRLVTGNLYNRGVEEFMQKKFDKALTTFEVLLTEIPNDTSVIFNAALAAEKIKNSEKAKMYFNQLLENNYRKPAIYQTLAQLAKAEKDTAKAIEYLAAGRKEFPNEIGLVIDELNIYLLQNRQVEAIKNLQDAIKLDPKNQSLFFALGTAYDQTKQLDKAVPNYLKAIELKPDYFDASYNLGALYFNRAAEMLNEANKIPFNEQKKFEAAKAKAVAEFKLAQPYLEKAHVLDPKDLNTMISLQQMYGQLNMTEKSVEMKKKREALK